MTTTTAYRPGDRVVVLGRSRFSGPATVEKVNPKTILVRTDSGHGVRVDLALLAPLTDAPDDGVVVGVPYRPAVVLLDGSVVRIKPGTRGAEKWPGLWVVTKWGYEKSNLSPLGGSPEGRYLRIVNDAVEVVPVSELKGAL